MWSFMKEKAEQPAKNNLVCHDIIHSSREVIPICSLNITGLHYHETNKKQYWNIKAILIQTCKKEFTKFSLPISRKLKAMEVKFKKSFVCNINTDVILCAQLD